MKKFLLTAMLGLAMCTNTFAQVEFIDADGNTIADGTTVVRNTISQPFPGGWNQVLSGLGLKNTSGSEVSFNLKIAVTDVPFGAFRVCYPGTCWLTVGNYTGSYPTHTAEANGGDGPWMSPKASLAANKVEPSIETEWYLNSLGMTTYDGQIGSYTATYQIVYANGNEGSTIKVLYSTDPNASTGIANIKNDAAGKKEVGRYTIDGQKMAQGAKGLAIVKYADGSAKKVVVK